jgi:hypothetical protein
MRIVVQREVPGHEGYWAGKDGTIQSPNGKITRGSLNKVIDYFMIGIFYKLYYVHRLIAFAWCENPRPDIFLQVHHIDQNEHNNCPENLMWVNTKLNNLQSSGYNCSFDKPMKRWKAYCINYGKQKHLGYFKTFLEAHRVGRAYRDIKFAKIYNTLSKMAKTLPG